MCVVFGFVVWIVGWNLLLVDKVGFDLGCGVSVFLFG